MSAATDKIEVTSSRELMRHGHEWQNDGEACQLNSVRPRVTAD